MLQFPRWRVDVTVGGDVVKTFHETATTPTAAIAKAKHKMRGAVSSAGAFRFKATKAEGESKGQHATKRRRSEAELVSDTAAAYDFVDRLKRGKQTKKSPAQLQREIDEALAKPMTKRSHATVKTDGTTPTKWYFWIRKKGMYGQSWKTHPSWFYHSSFTDKAQLDRAIREHKKDKWNVRVTLDREGKTMVKL